MLSAYGCQRQPLRGTILEMNMTFRRGDPASPRGHALIYFDASGKILASYVVVPPIQFDIGKYVPPMLSGSLGAGGFGGQLTGAFPLPPVPEEVQSLAYLEKLADARGDDLVFGGVVGSSMETLLTSAASAAQRYESMYRERPLEAEQAPAIDAPDDMDDMVYAVMPVQTKVAELAKLTGKLRYAIETSDTGLADETVSELERLGRHLPESYRVFDFLRVAREPGETNAKLTSLFVDRCYKMAAEDYAEVARIDRELKAAG